jgi:hypothetical protein
MKNRRSSIAACAALVVIVFVSGTASTEETEFARGAELLAPLKKELQQALVSGMQKGPLSAISVCKDKAPAIANSLSIEGVEMGRTSHRLRNPANSARDWVDTVLNAYLREDSDRAPELVTLPNGRLGYVEPIVVQSVCLACHGKSLAPDVAAQIKEAYPQDEATGFDVGDLRGVFWVEYPATE